MPVRRTRYVCFSHGAPKDRTMRHDADTGAVYLRNLRFCVPNDEGHPPDTDGWP